MKEQVARNIQSYRKEKGLTQDGLAQRLGVSYQAVSKWETAHSLPDLALLPELARLLEVSVDRLLGYGAGDRNVTLYEEAYRASEDYYWGTEPNEACFKVLRLAPPARRLKLLDIGCGEGKDAVFFARNGYETSAFDVTDAGVEKTRRLAERTGVRVDAFKADVNDFRPEADYDIYFSSGVLHYIKPDVRQELFSRIKSRTAPGGLHVLNVFVEKPFIAPPPEPEPYAYPWRSGELLAHYHDWLVEDSSEIVFDCDSSGIPHRHAMSTLIARRP
ncbi:methyltransferase domain-containing protein [Paenibacillus sp. B01]|uniref:methyltransferase domain-containing protein n=1 Tax=Paenibacillus sp. B01 TaxID=2660554 RepID=UPI00129B9DE3|nr:methyltransferase domain-containing protein [Paenibacillus sp. B01]QGG57812.1 methyltransferase domain-containing protein [Paenibacillus sp. B01]